MNSFFYKLTWIVLKGVFFILYPPKITGKENIGEAPAVICCNHSKAVDPFLVCMALKINYPICFMAKKQAFKIPLIKSVLNSWHAFPVDRGNSDISAVKYALRALKSGRSLIIFPEGTRVKEPFSVEAKDGCAMFAIRTGVDMIPVYIEHKKKLFHRCRIIVGEHVTPTHETVKGTQEDYQRNADEILKTIYELGDVHCK